MEWDVTNGSELKCRQRRFSLKCHTFTASAIFVRNTACQKYFFQILSQKNAQIVNLKNPDLDLIWRIHPECGFYGFMIRFWICPKKRKIRLWIRKSGFGFSQKKTSLRHGKTVSFFFKKAKQKIACAYSSTIKFGIEAKSSNDHVQQQ